MGMYVFSFPKSQINIQKDSKQEIPKIEMVSQ